MASEKANAEVSETSTDENQASSSEKLPNGEQRGVSNLGKTLAHRAIFGPGRRRPTDGKFRSNEVKALPSRLSKVSLADGRETSESSVLSRNK